MIRVWKLLKITIIMMTLTLLVPKVESNSTLASETNCLKIITKDCDILKEDDDKDCCEFGFCCKNAGKNNSHICENQQICCEESLHCYEEKPIEVKKGPTLGELSWVFSVVPLVIILIFFIIRAIMIKRWKRRQLQVQNDQSPELATHLQENNWQTNYSPRY